MTIRHHPSEDVLAAHAAGALPPALEFAVGAHVDLCTLCRREAALWRSVGGALLEGLPQATMAEGALDRALARAAAPEQKPAKSVSQEAALPSLPILAHAGRERWLAPGIRMRPLWRDTKTKSRAYLLRAQAGRVLPAHGHDGAEMTCVLSGAFWDGGERYEAGDFLEVSGAEVHQQRIDEAQECICVIGSDSAPRVGGIAGLVMRLRM